MDAATLGALGLDGLERLYQDAPLGPPPAGVLRGRFLCWLPTRGARRLHVRAMDTLLFRALAFGIDFDHERWFFIRPRVRVGHFDVTVGASRWRDTDTYRLVYEPSRLPRPLRDVLYDEVKPLTPDVCLGLGGLNAGRGDGDHFFFSLTR